MCEREKKGGGVLQGKGINLFFWAPWWRQAARGAGLLKNRSKVKTIDSYALVVRIRPFPSAKCGTSDLVGGPMFALDLVGGPILPHRTSGSLALTLGAMRASDLPRGPMFALDLVGGPILPHPCLLYTSDAADE